MGQVNLFKAVEAASDLVTRFGGHEAAVGVTLPTANLPEFERRLCAYMDEPVSYTHLVLVHVVGIARRPRLRECHTIHLSLIHIWSWECR